MGSIETTYVLENDLSVVKAVGRISEADFQEWAQDFYSGQVTADILWDLTAADLSTITNDDIQEIARRAGAFSSKRKGGRSAFVCGHDLAYGLSRAFEAYTMIDELPFQVQVFRDLDDAREWLGINNPEKCLISQQ